MKNVVVRNIDRAEPLDDCCVSPLDVADNYRLHTSSSNAIGNNR